MAAGKDSGATKAARKSGPKKAIAKRLPKKEPEDEVDSEAEEAPVAAETAGKKAKGADKAKKGRDAASKKAARRQNHPKEADEEEEEKDEQFEEGPEPGRKPKSKAHRMEVEKEEEERIPRGAIFVGNLPKGFYEPQMQKFFGQFGTVTRMKLARSLKNAGSKGFAFVEFEDEQVAEIVAKTMDKYIVSGQLMKVRMMEKVPRGLWKGSGKMLKDKSALRAANFMHLYNERPNVEVDGVMVPQVTKQQVLRREKSDSKLKERLKTLGVDFDLDHLEGEGEAGTKFLAEVNVQRKEKVKTKALVDAQKEVNKAAREARKETFKKKRKAAIATKKAAAKAAKDDGEGKKRKASDAAEEDGEAASKEPEKEEKKAKKEAKGSAAAASSEAASEPKKALGKKKKKARKA